MIFWDHKKKVTFSFSYKCPSTALIPCRSLYPPATVPTLIQLRDLGDWSSTRSAIQPFPPPPPPLTTPPTHPPKNIAPDSTVNAYHLIAASNKSDVAANMSNRLQSHPVESHKKTGLMKEDCKNNESFRVTDITQPITPSREWNRLLAST